MAVRRESVRLDLEGNFTSEMARNTAAALVFDKTLAQIDGKRVSTELNDTAKSVDKIGTSSRRTGPEINQLSGRLRLLTDAAITLGPALIPLGAATIPALTGALAGLGAAAGGIGAAILAFNGIGDAVKSIDDYRLEPTTENLQAMRVELQKTGVAGANFATYIANLEPELRMLQNTARKGVFPGVEDGIDALLGRLPQVNRIISELSTGLGNLARDAGQSLGGSEFTAFFDYVESDARPTLEAFGRSIGNLALGVGNMLVAFAPLSRDFTGGLEDMTKAFADWSANLDDNQSFQSFLSYIRESGPQAVEFLGAIAQTFAAFVEAAAPLGQAVLPALTSLVKVFGAILGSPIGPGLVIAAAAFAGMQRSAQLASLALDKFNISSDKTKTSLTKYASLAGGVLGVAAAVGAMSDNINRIDPTNLERTLTALTFGNVTGELPLVIDSLEQLNSTANQVDLGKVLSLGGTLFTPTLERYADNIDQVDQSLAQLVESGNADQAAEIFQRISDLAAARGVDPSETAKRFDAYALALQNAGSEAERAAALSALLGGPLNEVGDALHGAADGAQDFSGALSRLNGWFDKRDAVRAYKDAIDTLRGSLKDGFTREDAANLDAVGRSIIQVAQSIKNPEVRADFLAGARKSLQDIANSGGPKAQAAVGEIIAKMKELGLLKPKIDVDDKPARDKGQNLKGFFNDLVGHPYTAKVNAETAPAVSAVQGLLNRLGLLHDRTVHVNTVFSQSGRPGGNVPPAAGGTTVPKTGLPYADRHLYLLADGEEVISNRHGQADRHRALLKRINAGHLAAGGTAGLPPLRASDIYPRSSPIQSAFWELSTFSANLHDGTAGLKGFKAELAALAKTVDKSEKALDKQKSALEGLLSQRDSLSSSVSSSLLHDPFGKGLSGFDAQVAADTNDANAMLAALRTLVSNGLDPKGALFQELAAKGDLNLAQQLAQLSSMDLAARQAAFAQRGAISGQVGAFVGAEAFNAAIKDQTKATNEARDATKELRGAVRTLEAEIKKMKDHVKEGAAEGAEAGTYHGANQGTRDGWNDQTRRTHAQTRTGGHW